MRMMILTVAGKKKNYPERLTLPALIEQEAVENPDYVTVTINDAFVERGDFAQTILKDGDTVEFLYFMGGGTV
jgi:sulfur carrier protein